MRLPFFTFLAISLLAPALHAQSTVTLQDFDTSESASAAPREKPAENRTDCLLSSGNCGKTGMAAAADFSLEDVVNLKIESNAGTAIVPASTGSQSSAPLASIDMEILFDYNSDKVRQDQAHRLYELSEALKDDRFSDFTFLFVGHSDAKGSAVYNQDLSARRARAVANFVQVSAKMPEDKFAASGMGFERLKDQNDPFGPQNRRVQLVLVPR